MPLRFQSPLSNLCEVLLQVKEAASLYSATLQTNEASTRAALIDPILRALGWDTANPQMVEVEKTLEKTRADYVLNDESKKARIIVEAKALGVNIFHDQIVNSLISYAFAHKLSDVFITDGLVWHHYDHFSTVNFNPTKIIDLKVHNPVELAEYLIQKMDAANYWSVETTDPLPAKVNELEQLIDSLKTQIAQMTAVPVATMTSSAKPTTAKPVPPKTANVSTLRTELLSQITSVTGTKPTILCLPDGTKKNITSWSGILRECCLYCLSHNPNLSIPLVDYSGMSVHLFSRMKPPASISFFETFYQGKTLYVYTNYTADRCAFNAAYALQQVSGAASGMATVTFS